MKKMIKIKLLLVIAVLCLIPITNAAGMEAKADLPEPVIDLSGNEINDNNAGISKKHNVGISDKDIISSLIRDGSMERSVQKDAGKTPAPFEKNDDLYIPTPTKPALAEEEADNGSGVPDDGFVPGEVIICFKDEYSPSKIANLITNEKIVKTKDIYKSVYDSAKEKNSADSSKLESVKEEIGKYYVVTLSDKSQKGVLKIIKALNKLPNVKYAEPNYICKPCAAPNDYNNYKLWNMDRIQMPETWDSYPGKNIKVGILDTGIDANHPDLKNNVVTSLGWNCARKSNTDTLDYNKHGTHVAGTIGAEGNNSIGVVGVNPLAKLVPIKICISNTNSQSNAELMTEGILHATKNNIPVCNMSYTTPDSNIFRDAVKKYGQNGGTFIVAAGNRGRCIDDMPEYKSLAELDNVIIVTASDDNDDNHHWNFGNLVHVAAPGKGIWSTVPTSIVASGYKSESGSSMAAPHVTGVVSLMKGINPHMTPYEMRQVIINCSDPVPQLRGQVSSGGRLNAKRSLGTYLRVAPNADETMAAAIKRSLGSKSASDIKMMGLTGANRMVDGNSSRDSASAILPSLQYADVSNYKNELKKYSFYGCKNLTTVVLAEDGVKLPAYCFMNCTKLNTIHKSNNDNRKMNEADLSGLAGRSTGGFAAQTQCFWGCTGLKTIRVPNSKDLRFSNNVFDGCSNLDTVYIDTQTPVTGEADLTGLTQLTPCIFRGTGISTVKLAKDVSVGQEAFENCAKLIRIQVHPQQINQISVYDNSFYNVNQQCKAFMNQAFRKSSYKFHRSATEEIPKVVNSLLVWPVENEKIRDTINYYLEEETLSAHLVNYLVILGDANMGDSGSSESARILSNLKVVDMSSYTGSLGTYSFRNCVNLETVIRSPGISDIPAHCFMNCRKLTTIMEGNKSPKIWNEIDLTDLTGGLAVDTQAFDGCTKLTTVKLPSISIGVSSSFPNCSSLSTVYRDGGKKEEGTFDLTGVSTFWPGWGHNFENTAVREVKLPRGVEISEYCFNNCAKLIKIFFDPNQIDIIGIGSHAFYGVDQECGAFMNAILRNNKDFKIKRSDTGYITKVPY